jgi:hypothetical protein
VSLANVQAMRALNMIKQLQTAVNSSTVTLKGNSFSVPSSVAPNVNISSDSPTDITMATVGTNLMNIDATTLTKTQSGITFTVNSDKTITVTGTANADAMFNFSVVIKKYLKRFIGKSMIVYCDVAGTVSGSVIVKPDFCSVNLINCNLASNTKSASPSFAYQEATADGAYIYVTSGAVINATLSITLQEAKYGYSPTPYATPVYTEYTCRTGQQTSVISDGMAGKTAL